MSFLHPCCVTFNHKLSFLVSSSKNVPSRYLLKISDTPNYGSSWNIPSIHSRSHQWIGTFSNSICQTNIVHICPSSPKNNSPPGCNVPVRAARATSDWVAAKGSPRWASSSRSRSVDSCYLSLGWSAPENWPRKEDLKTGAQKLAVKYGKMTKWCSIIWCTVIWCNMI